MSQLNFHNNSFNPPPHAKLSSFLEKVKNAYLLWYGYYQILPKLHRHTLGQKIDNLFIEMIEAIAAANFLSREEKTPFVRLSIRRMDTLKILLRVLWETKSLDQKKYTAISLKLDEIGRMLGGWNGNLAKSAGAKISADKQNSLNKELGEK